MSINVMYRYSEVLEMETEVLWEHKDSPNVMTSLHEWIYQMAAGNIPHCSDAVISLISRLSGRIWSIDDGRTPNRAGSEHLVEESRDSSGIQDIESL